MPYKLDFDIELEGIFSERGITAKDELIDKRRLWDKIERGGYRSEKHDRYAVLIEASSPEVEDFSLSKFSKDIRFVQYNQYDRLFVQTMRGPWSHVDLFYYWLKPLHGHHGKLRIASNPRLRNAERVAWSIDAKLNGRTFGGRRR